LQRVDREALNRLSKDDLTKLPMAQLEVIARLTTRIESLEAKLAALVKAKPAWP
jgi:hypothetical protein